MGAIGGLADNTSVDLGAMLLYSRLPQISYGAETAVLSDPDLYPAALRTPHSDTTRMQGLIEILKEKGCDPKTIRRIAVATYELEMNQVVHSQGGTIAFFLDGDVARVVARDTGPGIPDLEQAMTEGFSTATDWVRSLGFGAGMGLPNARRVSDEFSIESNPEGTVVQVAVRLNCAESKEKEGEKS